MTDTVFQINSQVGQEFRKYNFAEKTAYEILQLRESTARAENELREKENARVLLKRRTSLNIKRTPTTQSGVNRQQSFYQPTTKTQIKDVEFTIINLESQTIGLKYEISALTQNYTNIEITDVTCKTFAGKFMKIWRKMKQLEKQYTAFFNELPITHEYNSHSSEIKSWMGELFEQLWKLKEEITQRNEVYKLKLKRKEEEQQRLLDNHFRTFRMRRNYECEVQIRDHAYSPVESEFGSGMSSISSISSVSSIGSN